METFALDEHVDGDAPTFLESRLRRAGRFAGGQKSSPIGSSCWMLTSSVAPVSPTRLPSLTFSSPIRPSIGANISTIAQIDPGVFDGGLRPGDFRLGVFDVDPVVGLGLAPGWPDRRRPGRRSSCAGLRPCRNRRCDAALRDSKLRSRRSSIWSSVNWAESRASLAWRNGHIFRGGRLLERRLRRRELGLGRLDLHLVRPLFDHQQQLPFLDIRPIRRSASPEEIPSREPGSSRRSAPASCRSA